MTKGTSVNVILDKAHNTKLNRAKKSSKRSKRQEAAARLSDHLDRYGESWGLITEKK